MTSKLHTKRIYMKNNEAHNRLELINGMIYILLACMSLLIVILEEYQTHP